MDELRPLRLEDQQLFKDAFALSRQKGWIRFFPFLYFFSQGVKKELLVYQDSGSVCLLLHKRPENDAPDGSLALYFPPVPTHPNALKNALALINDHNKSRQARIVWIDEHEVPDVAKILGSGFEVLYREEEYLYDPRLYRDLPGAKFAKMRHAFHSLQRSTALETVPYDVKYAEQCLALLTEWEATQGKKHGSIEDKYYTRNCLKLADRFVAPDLIGKVIWIDGEIKSFGFVGEMYDRIACGFIVKSNHEIQGLNNFMLCQLMQEMESCEWVNGGPDLGIPGLRFAKRMLRPVAMHRIYLARKVEASVFAVSGVAGKITESAQKIEQFPDFLHNRLEGLTEIAISDRSRYQNALEKTPQRIWMNYFPVLLALNLTPSRTVLLGEDSGSLCVYLLHQWPRQTRLHLYLPPMPYNNSVLQRCFQRINAFNGDHSGRLFWISESLRSAVEASGLLHAREYDQEFLYAPHAFRDLVGSKYQKLRHHLRNVEKTGEVHARAFTVEDKSSCLELLEKWRSTLSQKGIRVEGYAMSRACILAFEQFTQTDIQGWVYEIEGQIRGLAFGGHLAGTTGCSFVHVTDHEFPSLGYFVPYHFIKNLGQHEEVNEAGTGGLKGLQFVKKNLVPLRLESIYRGRQQHRDQDTPSAEAAADVLNGLKKLSYADHDVFRHCAKSSGSTAWVSFFPFLASLNKREQHSLYWELYRGSVCLYYLSERGSRKRLSLYFPPFPLRRATLSYAMDKVNLFNGDRKGEITWVEQQRCDDLIRWGYSLRHVDTDIVHTKESLDELLENRLAPINVTTRKFTGTDKSACLRLLEEWRAYHHEKGGGSTGYYFKRSCINDAGKYGNGNLIGDVLLVDGKIRGVCFAGDLRPGYTVIFVTVTAPDAAALEPYQHARMTRYFPGRSFVMPGADPDSSKHEADRGHGQGRQFHVYRASQPKRKSTEKPMRSVKDKNTALYMMAARELGLKVTMISAAYSYCVISRGKKDLHVYHNATSISDVATRKVTHNKYLSQNLFRKNAIPVPGAKAFQARDIDRILAYIETHKPVVIKPVKGSNSVGVTVDPRTEDDIRRAVSLVESDKVMIEQLVRGQDYRILLYNNEILDVLQWVPPYVVGNGADSVHSLVEEKNQYYLANSLHIIEMDFDYLNRQGVTMDLVPVKGQKIFLHQLSEPHVGGETMRMDIETIHPANREMFLRAAEVSGLPLAGLDFISEDLAVPYLENGAGVNEINSTPHIWPHYFAEQKGDLSAVKAILKGYFY